VFTLMLSFKTECYPNEEQIELIEKMFGVRRFIFNKFLTICKDTFGDLKKNKKDISKKFISDLRKNVFRTNYKHIVNTVPSQILETTMEDFNFALDSLWRKGKEIKLRKKKLSNTCRISRKNETNFKYEKDSKYLKIVRLGNLKLAESLRYKFNDNIKCITIKKQADRYFISITMDIDKEIVNDNITGKVVGLDWGIRTYFTGWDGEDVLEFNLDDKLLDKYNDNITRKNKAFSHKKVNSKNYFKAKTKLEKAYMKKNNYIEDELKKLAKYLYDNYDQVILEDLSMGFVNRGAIKTNRRTSRDKPFYKAKLIIHNKLKQYNKTLYEVDKKNTSKKCYKCGHIHSELGSSKIFLCPECGYEIDRDINAAMNIFIACERKEITL